MKHKIKEWLKRYLPAEVLSLLATVISSWIAFRLTQNNITTALVGTWVGNLFYFGTILITDIYETLKHGKKAGEKYSSITFVKNLRALFVEFGVAELIDSFLIRPFLMFYLPKFVGDLTLGVILAKFAADITFYIPAIISYELSKNKIRKFY